MAGIQIGSGFSLKSAQPLDIRLVFTTLTEMVEFPETQLYDGIVSYCTGARQTYQWKSNNFIDQNTGKWRMFGGGTTITAVTDQQYQEMIMEGTLSAEGYYCITDKDELYRGTHKLGSKLGIDDNEIADDVCWSSEKINDVTKNSVQSDKTGQKLVEITKADYDALVASGDIDEDTYYAITDDITTPIQIASPTRLGMIMVGDGLSIDQSGVLSSAVISDDSTAADKTWSSNKVNGLLDYKADRVRSVRIEATQTYTMQIPGHCGFILIGGWITAVGGAFKVLTTYGAGGNVYDVAGTPGANNLISISYSNGRLSITNNSTDSINYANIMVLY